MISTETIAWIHQHGHEGIRTGNDIRKYESGILCLGIDAGGMLTWWWWNFDMGGGIDRLTTWDVWRDVALIDDDLRQRLFDSMVQAIDLNVTKRIGMKALGVALEQQRLAHSPK